jgi:hypothetical protein
VDEREQQRSVQACVPSGQLPGPVGAGPAPDARLRDGDPVGQPHAVGGRASEHADRDPPRSPAGAHLRRPAGVLGDPRQGCPAPAGGSPEVKRGEIAHIAEVARRPGTSPCRPSRSMPARTWEWAASSSSSTPVGRRDVGFIVGPFSTSELSSCGSACRGSPRGAAPWRRGARTSGRRCTRPGGPRGRSPGRTAVRGRRGRDRPLRWRKSSFSPYSSASRSPRPAPTPSPSATATTPRQAHPPLHQRRDAAWIKAPPMSSTTCCSSASERPAGRHRPAKSFSRPSSWLLRSEGSDRRLVTAYEVME